TPGEAQGPSTNVVTVRVTDNGVPALSDSRSFTVVVNEVNTAPVLGDPGSQFMDEGETLTLSLVASDVDVPANVLSYSLVSGPVGAVVSSNGRLSWRAGEADGGTVAAFTVKVTDNGVPPLSDSRSFAVTVNEVNSAPVLGAVASQTI